MPIVQTELAVMVKNGYSQSKFIAMPRTALDELDAQSFALLASIIAKAPNRPWVGTLPGMRYDPANEAGLEGWLKYVRLQCERLLDLQSKGYIALICRERGNGRVLSGFVQDINTSALCDELARA